VDIYVDGDKLIWNGFSEGIVGDDNRNALRCKHLTLERLKQPLQTQVSLSTEELDSFNFEPGVHIFISLRDFKVQQ
jgi:hypothetical protein